MSKNFVRGGGLCVALILVTLLFNAKCSKATSVNINSSSSFSPCNRGSSIDDCLDEDLDFVMGSEAGKYVGFDVRRATEDRNKQSVDCGRYKSKKSCLPNPNDIRVAEHCYVNGVYTENRSCPK